MYSRYNLSNLSAPKVKLTLKIVSDTIRNNPLNLMAGLKHTSWNYGPNFGYYRDVYGYVYIAHHSEHLNVQQTSTVLSIRIRNLTYHANSNKRIYIHHQLPEFNCNDYNVS